uniref:Uncharacterized protein n=1 Tax=Glossina palpalis gambiensis TaxID=67801 RepID=A0A1B0ATR0_9MUSC
MFAKYAGNIGVPTARLFSNKPERPQRRCPKIIEPRCDPKDENVGKDHKLKLTEKVFTANPKKSMWEFPECSGNICQKMPVRMDELYYKMSDKRRTYTQTWKTGPSLRTEVSEIYPPICRAHPAPTRLPRIKTRRITACRFARHVNWLIPCKGQIPKRPCPWFVMENCPNVYGKWKNPVKCEKVPTPYPCYSDCERSGQVVLRSIECKCLDRPAMCEIWEQLRRRKAFIKGREPDIGPFFERVDVEYKLPLDRAWKSIIRSIKELLCAISSSYCLSDETLKNALFGLIFKCSEPGSCESLFIEFGDDYTRILFGFVYFPNGNLNMFEARRLAVLLKYSKITIVGDFNCILFKLGFRLFALQSPRGVIRHGSRKDCGIVVEPKCDPKNPDVCKGREVKVTGRAYVIPREENSMWEYPECCANACLDLPARMDELHYKMSDKLVRQYSQTWAACPPLRIRETVICPEPCEAIPLPSRPIRKKGEGNSSADNPQLACPQPKLQGLIGCKDTSKHSCPHLELKGCAPSRSPPSCGPDQNILSKCKKEPTPYPCFSECQRPKPDPLNPTECKCNDPLPMCLVWEEFRRRLSKPKPKEQD